MESVQTMAIRGALEQGQDPAVIAAAVGCSLDEVQQVCGEDGHSFAQEDNGEEGFHLRVWRMCAVCGYVPEGDDEW